MPEPLGHEEDLPRTERQLNWRIFRQHGEVERSLYDVQQLVAGRVAFPQGMGREAGNADRALVQRSELTGPLSDKLLNRCVDVVSPHGGHR